MTQCGSGQPRREPAAIDPVPQTEAWMAPRRGSAGTTGPSRRARTVGCRVGRSRPQPPRSWPALVRSSCLLRQRLTPHRAAHHSPVTGLQQMRTKTSTMDTPKRSDRQLAFHGFAHEKMSGPSTGLAPSPDCRRTAWRVRRSPTLMARQRKSWPGVRAAAGVDGQPTAREEETARGETAAPGYRHQPRALRRPAGSRAENDGVGIMRLRYKSATGAVSKPFPINTSARSANSATPRSWMMI